MFSTGVLCFEIYSELFMFLLYSCFLLVSSVLIFITNFHVFTLLSYYLNVCDGKWTSSLFQNDTVCTLSAKSFSSSAFKNSATKLLDFVPRRQRS